MHWVTITAIYFTVWWTVLFAVLPWGVHQQTAPEPGTEPGAPAKPLLLKKFVATSLISAVITAAIWGIGESGWLSFREMAREGAPFR
ncbi:MAG TPA: DUF1467 family protein [Azospirillaceae bacterium]|nr:DUF1467 family protein [Azospirillaceae bacterium]